MYASWTRVREAPIYSFLASQDTMWLTRHTLSHFNAHVSRQGSSLPVLFLT